MSDNAKDLRCSFCTKSIDEVGMLISGPEVYICDLCVDLCNGIIEENIERASDAGAETEHTAIGTCDLCRLPKDVSELRRIREKGALCTECIDAVQNDVGAGIHHVDITVSDLARSTEFYDRVLPLLGFRRVPDTDGNPVWAAGQAEVGLQPARVAGRHDRYSPGLHHLAFSAPERGAVDALFRELDHLGITILDEPSQYDEYAPGYYAVFFADPDGMKLEYVFTPEWPV